MTDSSTTSDGLAHFVMPVLRYNEEGWGPCELPETFKDMPYQPFSKSDRLGKISDWTGSTQVDKKYPSIFIYYIIIVFFF